MLRCGEAGNHTGSLNPVLELFGLRVPNGTLAIQDAGRLFLDISINMKLLVEAEVMM